MSRKIGYARVSSTDQNLELQIVALKKAGCCKIYSDHGVSGKQENRPEFDRALKALKPGDTLFVWRLDRLSRSLRHLIEINDMLTGRGVRFESITEKVDTSTHMGEFTFHLHGALAQLETGIIIERTLAGLAIAAQNGRYPGRPRKCG
jgi:DNA invertase Pin-like site-specific DNA recombinase